MDVHILGELQGARGIRLPNLSCHYKLVRQLCAPLGGLSCASSREVDQV
jgi:hypothetical protein